MSYKYITETLIYLRDNEQRKLFVTKQCEGCKFMPKIHKSTFGGRAPLGSAVGAYAPPGPLAAIEGAASKGDKR